MKKKKLSTSLVDLNIAISLGLYFLDKVHKSFASILLFKVLDKNDCSGDVKIFSTLFSSLKKHGNFFVV